MDGGSFDLGGNASTEIGLTPRGETGPMVKALSARSEDGDLAALDLLRAEQTVSVFLEHQVFDLTRAGDRIVSVDAREARTGRQTRFRAEMFIDCTGTAILGLLAGAEIMFGYESRAEFDESLAPEDGSSRTTATPCSSGPGSWTIRSTSPTSRGPSRSPATSPIWADSSNAPASTTWQARSPVQPGLRTRPCAAACCSR